MGHLDNGGWYTLKNGFGSITKEDLNENHSMTFRGLELTKHNDSNEVDGQQYAIKIGFAKKIRTVGYVTIDTDYRDKRV